MNHAGPIARTGALLGCLLAAAGGCIIGCNSDPITQALLIGSPCTMSSECGSPPHFYCDTVPPGGYCKKDCNRDSDCPDEAICAFDGAVGTCHNKCISPNGCRYTVGYVCKSGSKEKETLASLPYCDVPGKEEPDLAVPGDDMAVAGGDMAVLQDGGADMATLQDSGAADMVVLDGATGG